MNFAFAEAAHLFAPHSNANGLYESNHHWCGLRIHLSNMRASKADPMFMRSYTRIRTLFVGNPAVCPIAVA